MRLSSAVSDKPLLPECQDLSLRRNVCECTVSPYREHNWVRLVLFQALRITVLPEGAVMPQFRICALTDRLNGHMIQRNGQNFPQGRPATVLVCWYIKNGSKYRRH